MRNRLFVMVGALLLISAGAGAQNSPAAGQGAPKPEAGATSLPSAGFVNQIDFGVRGTTFDTGSDKARFERYRDLRNGGTLDLFRFDRTTAEWKASLSADHLGYRDESFTASYNRFGKVKMSFTWNQVPLFYSQSTRSLSADQGNGEIRIINPGVRTEIQDGTLKVQNASDYLGGPFDLRQRRDVAAFGVVATLTRAVDLKVNVTSTHKRGEMPWGATFGFSAGNEIAAPIDHRTNDVGAALEWAGARGTASVGYDGSFFNNSIQTLVFDSPYRATDSTNRSAYVSGNGTSQGRMSMWPDSTANTFTAAAGYKLPGRSHVAGSASYGDWKQDGTLIPVTINSAIPAVTLPRATADADARVTALNVNFTSRPADLVWLDVRARRYDFDNRTPEFHLDNYVRADQVLEGAIDAKPISYTRDNVDADLSLTPLPYTAIKVGYGLEQMDHTERYFATTREHTFRAAVDTVGNQYASFRLAYQHARRRGAGFDEQALVEAGQQPQLGQFDIANRDRDRVTASVTLTPVEVVSIFASAGTGRDNFPDNYFGLTKFDTNSYSLGFDVSPAEKVDFGLTYSFDNAKTHQASRQANPGPQFTDPTRDWFTAMNERVHYVVANADLIKAIPRTDVRCALDWNRATDAYVYSLTPDTTLPTPVPLPRVLNELLRATVDVQYHLTRHVAAGFGYMYEDYKVDDFAMSPQYAIGNRTLADGVTLGYFLQPYTANTGWFRLIYFW